LYGKHSWTHVPEYCNAAPFKIWIDLK
jgi:hypothetical protein